MRSSFFKNTTLLLLCSLLVCCTPQKRLQRLVKRHPYLINTDTIIQQEEIIIESSQVDTFLDIRTFHNDTTIIIENNQVIQTIKVRDSLVFVECEQKTDTVYTEKVIIKDNAAIQNKHADLYKWSAWILGGLFLVLFLFVVGVVVRKVIKPSL